MSGTADADAGLAAGFGNGADSSSNNAPRDAAGRTGGDDDGVAGTGDGEAGGKETDEALPPAFNPAGFCGTTGDTEAAAAGPDRAGTAAAGGGPG